MLLNKGNVHLTRPTPALTPVYLTSRRGVDTEDGSLASDHDYHIVICSVTRGLVQRPGRLWTPCVMLPTNPAPYTIVEWGIQTARYTVYGLGTECVYAPPPYMNQWNLRTAWGQNVCLPPPPLHE